MRQVIVTAAGEITPVPPPECQQCGSPMHYMGGTQRHEDDSAGRTEPGWRCPEQNCKKREAATGVVYFILQEHDRGGIGLTKVGWAKNPLNRLRELQTGNPYELELIGTFPGTIKDEKWAHRELSSFHIRGEWFALYGCWEIVEQQRSLAEVVSAIHADFEQEQAELLSQVSRTA